MMVRGSLSAVLLLGAVVHGAAAQTPLAGADKRIPMEPGFRVYVLVDMEGMGSAVKAQEVIAGNEGPAYRERTGPDYWTQYREMLTAETNAVIRGARAGGARSFVVNEGHGGNLFGSLLPWDLDTAAVLIRGWPKPMVMSTGVDSTAGALFFIGAHANAGTPGVMAHTYAFDRFSVNGRVLNETGINALVAGEYGVPVVLVSGDDVVIAQAKEQLGPQVVGVVTKWAIGRSAAITLSPAVVRQRLADSAAVAIARAMRGEFRPFTLERPYRVEFTLRHSYPAELIAPIDTISGFALEKTSERSYRFVTRDAREMARLLDVIELVVLR